MCKKCLNALDNLEDLMKAAGVDPAEPEAIVSRKIAERAIKVGYDDDEPAFGMTVINLLELMGDEEFVRAAAIVRKQLAEAEAADAAQQSSEFSVKEIELPEDLQKALISALSKLGIIPKQ